MNKVILIGNLTRDPEFAQTSSNVPYLKMSVAVSRKFASANGERETDFFNIVAWRGLAENCAKYLCKGKKISVVGNLQNRSYEDSQGNKRQITEIIAEEIDFLSPVGEASQQQTQDRYKADGLTPVDDNELPF
ncbi:MAG: single-stranded DNA-binding protein [Clostridia bacterium]|nr:single-stranded DNA-binding protein [Clostridia bacterium]